MTPELRSLITSFTVAVTCKNCLGNGALAWRNLEALPGGVHRTTFGYDHCSTCFGLGINPLVRIPTL